MNSKTTLALVAVALALVALVLLVERPEGSPRVMNVTPYPTTLPAVVALEEGTVRRLTLTRIADGATVVLVRDDAGDWQVAEPVQGPADAWTLGTVLGTLTNLQPERRLEPGSIGLSEVGLDPAQVVLEAELADGSVVRLAMGAENPQGTAQYAQVEGDAAIYLISRGLYMQAEEMFAEPPLQPTPTPEAPAE